MLTRTKEGIAASFDFRIVVMTASICFICAYADEIFANESSTRNCVRADGQPAETVAKQVGLDAALVTGLQETYSRISEVAKLLPDLYICQTNIFNASAAPGGERRDGILNFTGGLLTIIAGDRNVLARIVGHEFAHLLLRHQEAKRLFQNEAIAKARRRAWYSVNRWGWDSIDLTSIRQGLRFQFSLHSQEIELEADEIGFTLATSAGYSLNVAKKLGEILRLLGDTPYASYFSSHPGYAERLELGVFQEQNTSMLRKARQFYDKQNWRALGEVVSGWTKRVPDSAASYFYLGLWLHAGGKDNALISESFEDSYLRYERPAIAMLSQSAQPEAELTPLLLSLALYQEGEKLRSLSVAGKFSNDQLVNYRRLTGWEGALIVSNVSQAESEPDLWHAKSPDGVIVISNLASHKDERWMKPAHAWNAPRPPKALAATAVPAKPAAVREVFSDLFDAARRGEPVDLHRLLSVGEGINSRQLGLTLLGAAVLAGNVENVRYLLTAGANPDARDGFRHTARDYALRNGRVDMLMAMNEKQ